MVEFTEAEENYKVIDESVVEEIIVDDDLPEVKSKPPEKKPDVSKQKQQSKKHKEKLPEKSKTKPSSKKGKSKHEEL